MENGSCKTKGLLSCPCSLVFVQFFTPVGAPGRGCFILCLARWPDAPGEASAQNKEPSFLGAALTARLSFRLCRSGMRHLPAMCVL